MPGGDSTLGQITISLSPEGGFEISSRNVDPKALLAISAWRRQYPRSDNHLTLSRERGIINVCCFC